MEVTFIPYLQLTSMLSIDVLFTLGGYSHLRVLANRIIFLLLYFVSVFWMLQIKCRAPATLSAYSTTSLSSEPLFFYFKH